MVREMVIEENELWKMIEKLKSERRRGNLLCRHSWVLDEKFPPKDVEVHFVRNHGEITVSNSIPGIEECISCGRRRLSHYGIIGLHDSSIPRMWWR